MYNRNMEYLITCTSTCDLNDEILKSNNINYVSFKFMIDGNEYEDNFFKDYDYEKFYNDIENGLKPTTSQVGYGAYLEFFEEILKEGKDIIHICLSSGISGDYMTARSVAEELNEIHDNKIYVVDSLGASSGYGLLVLLAKNNQEKKMSFKENINWLEDNKLKIQHLFISTDLSSYVRGGRMSSMAGFVGTALKICPLMYMPKDGTLNVLEKIRTKQKAMQALVSKMYDLIPQKEEYDGYCMMSTSLMDDDANKLAIMIKERFPKIEDIKIYHVGTTIGSHTGKGTIALYFIGESRE